jgi:hypothetical protein
VLDVGLHVHVHRDVIAADGARGGERHEQREEHGAERSARYAHLSNVARSVGLARARIAVLSRPRSLIESSVVGQELKTSLRFDGRILEGVALLEGDSIIFRGEVSLTVKFTEIFKVEANAGWLDLQTGRGLLLFELGPKAEVWAEKIKNPKALIEKLGFDATAAEKKVAVVGKLDADLRSDLDASGAKIAKSARGRDFDMIFVAASSKKDLEKLASYREMIKDDGGIWIVYPKGSAELTERDVLTAGRTLQLTDNKQVKVSEVLTSVRFVIPVALRKKKK